MAISISAKARKIKKILNDIYPNPQIPLKHKNHYTLLIAVLLSAQCTDMRVNMVTPVLFSKAETPQDMVNLGIENIESIIRSCGLSSTKSRAIWNLSQQLLDLHDGKVPDSFEALEKLPGVGHKTASVIMTHAFHREAFPVDTHIHRCAKRWGLSEGKNVRHTEEDLKKLFPSKDWEKLHLQIINFGRTYCPALRHDVKRCPICSWASTYA